MDDQEARSPELTWQGCRRCRRRRDCPYLRGGEPQRRRCIQARLLDAEAERLLAAVAQAEDAAALLRADESLERTLAQLLSDTLTLT